MFFIKQDNFGCFFLTLAIVSTVFCHENMTVNEPFFKYSLETDVGLSTGFWIPTHNLSILGNHPEIGLIVRGSLRPIFWKVGFYGCLNPYTPQNYNVLVNDTLKVTHNCFVGDLISINCGMEIYRNSWYCSDFGWSFGINGLDVIRENEKLNIKSKSLWSFRNGPVIGCRFYIKRFILNPEISYSFLFFNNPGAGATDLTGDALSLRMHFTFIEKIGIRKNCHPYSKSISNGSQFRCPVCDSINHAFSVSQATITENYWKQLVILQDIFNIPDTLFFPFLSGKRLPIINCDSVCINKDKNQWAFDYTFQQSPDAFLKFTQYITNDTVYKTNSRITYLASRSFYYKIDSLLLLKGFSKHHTENVGRVILGYLFNLFIDFENPKFMNTYEKGGISISTYPYDKKQTEDPPHIFKTKPISITIEPNLLKGRIKWMNSIKTCENHFSNYTGSLTSISCANL